MAQPSEEDIDSVIAFTDFTDRNLIAAALKAKNNNLDQVVNEIFDDRTKFISTYGWDDKAFAGPRDGSPNSQIPSFAIHAADDGQVLQGVDPYYQGQIGAPSRPPSRTNNRSPLSRLVDYAADNTTSETPYSSLDGMLSNQGAGNTLPPTSVEQEDAELQQAIAASVATSNMQSPQPQPQESGITETDPNQPYFGPANRSEYNQNEWAMITLHQDKPEPEPSRRKREGEVPAFLRCRQENSWETHRVGAIITIFHAIPAARNSLLRLGAPPPQGYGHSAEWWKGKPILPATAQVTHEAGELSWGDELKSKWPDELHRLMAFLDATDRCYGTADVLADTAPEGQRSGIDSERDFLSFLGADPNEYDTIRPFVTTCQLASIQDDELPLEQSDNFIVIDFPYTKQQLASAASIYSMWDRMFYMDYRNWAGDEHGAKCALITEPADILTMRVTGDDGLPHAITFPKIFYLDRYLNSNRAEISKIQRQAYALAKAVARAENAERRVTMVIDPANNKEMSRIDLNRAAIRSVKTKSALVKQWALWRMHQEVKEQTGVEPQTLPPPDTPDDEISWTEEEARERRFLEAKVLQLEDELARVEEEVTAIKNEKDRVIDAVRQLEQRLTAPDERSGFTPQHAYTLRGVAISVEIFYVCVPTEPDLMQIDEADSSIKPADQWWKLGYVANDEDPIKAEMTTYEKVVEEACVPGSKPLLIYASDKAMEEKPDQLSDALQTFIRFDNHLFKKELVEETPRDKKRGGFASPASPSKRVQRSSSLDSMATNAASAGDFDDDMRDAPFDAEEDPFLVGDGSVETASLIDTSVPDVPTPASTIQYEDEQPAAVLHSIETPSGLVNGYHDTAPPIDTATSSPSTIGRDSSSVRLLASASMDELVNRTVSAASGPHSPIVAVPRPSKTFPISPGPPTSQANKLQPEMQERSRASPFLPHQGGGIKDAKSAMMDMELDDDHVHEQVAADELKKEVDKDDQ